MSALHPVLLCVRRAARWLRLRRALQAAVVGAGFVLAGSVCLRLIARFMLGAPTAAHWLALADLPLTAAGTSIAALVAGAVAAAWPVSQQRVALAIDRRHGLADLISSTWQFAQWPAERQTAFVRAALDQAARVAEGISGSASGAWRVPRGLVGLAALFAAALVAQQLRPTAEGRALDPPPARPPPSAASNLAPAGELARYRAALRSEDARAPSDLRSELQDLLSDLEAGRIDRVSALRKLRELEESAGDAIALAARVERALRELAERFGASNTTRALAKQLGAAPGRASKAAPGTSGGELSALPEGTPGAQPAAAGSARAAHQRALDLAAARAELERLASGLRQPQVDPETLEALRAALDAALARPASGAEVAAIGGGPERKRLADDPSAAAQTSPAAGGRRSAQDGTVATPGASGDPGAAAGGVAPAGGHPSGSADATPSGPAAPRDDGFADRFAANLGGPDQSVAAPMSATRSTPGGDAASGARSGEPPDRISSDSAPGRELERLERDLDRAEQALGDSQPSAAADSLERAGHELERLQDARSAAAEAPALADQIAELRDLLRRGGGRSPGAERRVDSSSPSAAAGGAGPGDPDLAPAPGASPGPSATSADATPTRVAGVAQAGPTRSQVIYGAAGPGGASAEYARVHADYAQHAERELEREPIPQGYRLYVRRYFQLIGPPVARAGDERSKP